VLDIRTNAVEQPEQMRLSPQGPSALAAEKSHAEHGTDGMKPLARMVGQMKLAPASTAPLSSRKNRASNHSDKKIIAFVGSTWRPGGASCRILNDPERRLRRAGRHRNRSR